MNNALTLLLTDELTPGGAMRVIDSIFTSQYLDKARKHRKD